MRSEWKRIRLGDVASFKTGKLNSNAANENGIYPFFTCSPETLYINNYAYDEKALLLAGNNANGNFSIKYFEGKFNAYQRTYIINNKENATLKYLLYSIKLSLDNFKNISQGTATKFLTMPILNSFEINLPPLEEQKAIADVLSALDDKIELNNRINKNLEEQAQTIFKRWFVDFDFPDSSGNPYRSSGGEMQDSELGEIPKGWKVLSLEEIAVFINGYSYKGSDLIDSRHAMATIKNFERNGGFKIDGFKEVNIINAKKQHFINIFDIFVAHTDITQNADIIGNAEQVLSFSKYDSAVFSMDLVKVIGKNKNLASSLLFALLKYGSFKQHALGYVSGTTVLHLSKKALPEYKFAISIDDMLLNEANALFENISKRKRNIINENQKLAELRDYLLPKLMSGEIRVDYKE